VSAVNFLAAELVLSLFVVPLDFRGELDRDSVATTALRFETAGALVVAEALDVVELLRTVEEEEDEDEDEDEDLEVAGEVEAVVLAVVGRGLLGLPGEAVAEEDRAAAESGLALETREVAFVVVVLETAAEAEAVFVVDVFVVEDLAVAEEVLAADLVEVVVLAPGLAVAAFCSAAAFTAAVLAAIDSARESLREGAASMVFVDLVVPVFGLDTEADEGLVDVASLTGAAVPAALRAAVLAAIDSLRDNFLVGTPELEVAEAAAEESACLEVVRAEPGRVVLAAAVLGPTFFCPAAVEAFVAVRAVKGLSATSVVEGMTSSIK